MLCYKSEVCLNYAENLTAKQITSSQQQMLASWVLETANQQPLKNML